MKKRIIDYRKRIDELIRAYETGTCAVILGGDGEEENMHADSSQAERCDTDWDAVLEEHLTQIAFFQHERLVHLIVTMTVAILLMLSLGVVLTTCFLPMLAVSLLFLVLLIPYIFHYYTLENEVQKMYEQYDRILELRK